MTDRDEFRERFTFLHRLEERLTAGAEEYGNASFDKPIAKTVTELEDEALDIAGWAYVMWSQLRRKCTRLQSGVDNASDNRP